MLTSKALHSEITSIEKTMDSMDLQKKDPIKYAELKIGTLTLKMLASIRTNQVLIMKKMGVNPIAPRNKDEIE